MLKKATYQNQEHIDDLNKRYKQCQECDLAHFVEGIKGQDLWEIMPLVCNSVNK